MRDPTSDNPANAKHSNATQLGSPAYRLAALDQDFLLGDSMRGVRFLLEYAKAEEALRRWAVVSTIVVFGSARVRQKGPAQQAWWYEQARAFGRIASERGGALRADGTYGSLTTSPTKAVPPVTLPAPHSYSVSLENSTFL